MRSILDRQCNRSVSVLFEQEFASPGHQRPRRAVDRQPLAVSHRTASKENGGPLAHGQWLSEIGIPAAPFDDPEPLELSKDAEQRQLVAARCSTGTPATV